MRKKIMSWCQIDILGICQKETTRTGTKGSHRCTIHRIFFYLPIAPKFRCPILSIVLTLVILRNEKGMFIFNANIIKVSLAKLDINPLHEFMYEWRKSGKGIIIRGPPSPRLTGYICYCIHVPHILGWNWLPILSMDTCIIQKWPFLFSGVWFITSFYTFDKHFDIFSFSTFSILLQCW